MRKELSAAAAWRVYAAQHIDALKADVERARAALVATELQLAAAAREHVGLVEEEETRAALRRATSSASFRSSAALAAPPGTAGASFRAHWARVSELQGALGEGE